MHEHTFVDSIVRDIEDRGNVKGIVLEVGELVGIELEHLKRHIEERFSWEVEISEKNALVSCECGFDGRPLILERLHYLVVFECPECGEVPEVLGGKDIKILKVIYK